jgi:hypothetical protein
VQSNIDITKGALPGILTMLRQRKFDPEPILSFDNLAIEQLGVKNLLSEQEWQSFYMGDDGQFSCYYDATENIYMQSSSCDKKTDGVQATEPIAKAFKILQKK